MVKVVKMEEFYQNTFGGLVTTQQLTSSTTTLIQAYTGDSLSLSNFITEYVTGLTGWSSLETPFSW